MTMFMGREDSKSLSMFFRLLLWDGSADTRCRGVFTDSSLGLVLYYHYADPDVGLDFNSYLFGWNALSWSDDGWPMV